nr:MAK10-like protein [Tanacetum cinerariifolium]
MGDANHIRTLGDYSKPSQECYKNTIELPKGNNMVPLRSDTIRLVQNGCSFYGLRPEVPNQHLKDFLKLVDSLDLYGANRERTQRRLSSLGTQLRRQQDDMINKINTLWKVFSKKVDETSPHDTAGNPTAQMNFASTNYPTKEELQDKGIKTPSKLLSSKYLSQSSLAEQNRNPSFPKRVYFLNSIIILNKEDEAKEEGNMESSATEYKNHEMTVEAAEEVESEVKFEEETKEEIEEEEEDNARHFDTFPTMKKLRLHYNWIMSSRLELKRKPSDPKKICNFMGRVKGLKFFIGNFTYECDFMVLEDTTSVIDNDLGSVIFKKLFVETTRLVYDIKEGTVLFEKDKEKIVFKLPHEMEMFKRIDFTDIKTDHIPPFVIRSAMITVKKPTTQIA